MTVLGGAEQAVRYVQSTVTQATVTYAGSLEYIDYRTFNLITQQSVLTLGTGMHLYQMGFLVAVCPHWVP